MRATTLDAKTLLDRVRKKFKPPPKLLVSEWSQARRYLSPESSAEPGRWKNDRTPYLPGIMDATCESGVHQIAVMCSAQVGKTEGITNVVGTEQADPHRGVYYICENCDHPIEEKHKITMVKQGQWIATAVSQDGTVGFHLNEMYSLWRRWLDICLDYESCRLDPAQYKVWHNTSLGLPYEQLDGEKLDWQRLRDRGAKSNYSQGTVPNGGLILTA